jgi:hypothetical protein
MNERDEELDRLLAPLRTPAAAELELKRWQKAVRAELSRARRARPWLIPTAAALALGFLVGRLTPGRPESAPIAEPVATIEYVYAKSE